MASVKSFVLCCLLLLFAMISFAGSATGAERPPNIVFFLVDDLGWRDVGCYGSAFYETPNVDQLARDGIRFTQAYAACHVCSPTRASIMTGKYPARIKLTDWIPGRRNFAFQKLTNLPNLQALPLEEITLAEALRSLGYATGHFGKWHLGEDPNGPLQQGFDTQVPRWNKGWPNKGYHAPFGLEDLNGTSGDYLTDRLTDEALRFIDKNRDRPFFLYLSHFAVHDPIQGRDDLVQKYLKKAEQLPSTTEPSFVLEGNPDAAPLFSIQDKQRLLQRPDYAGHQLLPNRMVKIKQRQDNPQFAAMVEAMDESLGRVIGKLESLDLTSDTIVVFFSDNGGMSAANYGRPGRVISAGKLDQAYSTSNLPLRGAKGWLYEGGIRVPLIIRWPGSIAANRTCEEPVISTDFYPTLLEAVGAESITEQDGVSLMPVLRGEAFERGPLYWHFPHYSNHGLQSPGGAIRVGRYKLLEYFENGSLQLFDLQADPGEKHDLSAALPEKKAELHAMLRAWRQRVGTKPMLPNPNYRADAPLNSPPTP